MKNFKNHIEYCFELIEQKLGRGPRKEWNTDDFEFLSKQIMKETGALLSISTLKRLSGRVNYASKPNISTLNTLVKYLGHENWRAFLRRNVPFERTENKKLNKVFKSKSAIFIFFLVVGLYFFLPNLQRKKSYNSDDFIFRSRQVSIGLPNSVVFEYNVSAAKDGSKIEIQQDWDNTKRIVIDSKDSIATSIYYRPGFFKSKLLVDSTIVKERDVFITTQDWMGIIEKEPRPIYLNDGDFFKENKIAIEPEILTRHNLDPRTNQVIVSFYLVKDFGELNTDNFEISTTFKNDFNDGMNVCQVTQVLILYDGGTLEIPLAKKGCSSDLTLFTFDGIIDGKKNDLSGFGVDFSNYVQLKCVSENKKLDIKVNNELVYKMNVPKSTLKIKGIIFHFEGAGSVKNVTIKDNDRIVYSSDFRSRL